MQLKLFILSFVLTSSYALASEKKIETNKKSIATTISLGLSTNTQKIGSKKNTFNTSLSIDNSTKINEALTAGIEVSGKKNMAKDRKTVLNDPEIYLSHSSWEKKNLSLSNNFILQVPLSKESKDITKLKAATTWSPNLVWANPFSFEHLKAIFLPTLTRYFHQYNKSLSGVSNGKWDIQHRLVLKATINDQWSAFIDQRYGRSFTHDGKTADSYAFIEGVSYKINKTLSTTLYFASGGNPLKENGVGNEIQVINKNGGKYGLSLSASF